VSCWRETASGFKYADRDGTPDGIQKLELKEGLDGRTKIGLKARGVLLDDPPLPFAPPVTVQLRNGNGICWEAVYSAPASRNVAGPPGQFRDSAD
jgi:hypothetical protein